MRRAPLLVPFALAALALGVNALPGCAAVPRAAHVAAVEAPPRVAPVQRAICEYIPITYLVDGTEVLRPAECWEA